MSWRLLQTARRSLRFTGGSSHSALALVALGAHAASPKIEGAIQVFRSVASDPAKLATVCQLAKVMDEAGDHLDAATEEKVETIVKQVGSSSRLGDELDEDSPDAVAYDAALDELASNCN